VTQPLPRLRVQRNPWNLTRLLARFSKGVAKVDAQREPYATYWDEANVDAMSEDGPLWLALGDSAVQGVGASSPDAGWVPKVLERLQVENPAWRVINVSMTGARMTHVVDDQLPLIASHGLDPTLVTCMIGTNDFLGGSSAARIRSDAKGLFRQLPTGTYFGRGGGPGQKRSAAFQQSIDAAVAAGSIRTFDPYRWPDRRDCLAEDRFHPNDRGCKHIAENFWQVFRP